MVKVYDAERLAGLEQVIAESQVLAFTSQLSLVDKSEFSLNGLPKNLALGGINSFDLYNLKSILVSVGWNLNDDVFHKDEVWAAKHTPEHKPLDIEHDHRRIIGHMIKSYPVDADLNLLDEENDPPDEYDIFVESVIYRYWKNQDQADEINKLIDEVEAGLWFVSMECLLANFDYAFINAEGEAAIIPRNENTAHLTKYLRRYGGEGSFNGYRIGRLLRDFVFSGKGLVKKPANKKSIIYAGIEKFKVNNKLDLTEVTVEAKQLEDRVAELTKQAEQATAKLTEAQEQLAKANDTIKTKEAEVADLNKKLTEANEAAVKTSEELKKVNESLASMTAEKVKAERTAALREVCDNEEEIKTHYENFANMDDNAFKSVVTFMKANKSVSNNGTEENTESDKSGEAAAAGANLESAKASETTINPPGDNSNQREEAVAKMSSFMAESFGISKNKGVK